MFWEYIPMLKPDLLISFTWMQLMISWILIGHKDVCEITNAHLVHNKALLFARC